MSGAAGLARSQLAGPWDKQQGSLRLEQPVARWAPRPFLALLRPREMALFPQRQVQGFITLLERWARLTSARSATGGEWQQGSMWTSLC